MCRDTLHVWTRDRIHLVLKGSKCIKECGIRANVPSQPGHLHEKTLHTDTFDAGSRRSALFEPTRSMQATARHRRRYGIHRSSPVRTRRCAVCTGESDQGGSAMACVCAYRTAGSRRRRRPEGRKTGMGRPRTRRKEDNARAPVSETSSCPGQAGRSCARWEFRHVSAETHEAAGIADLTMPCGIPLVRTGR